LKALNYVRTFCVAYFKAIAETGTAKGGLGVLGGHGSTVIYNRQCSWPATPTPNRHTPPKCGKVRHSWPPQPNVNQRHFLVTLSVNRGLIEFLWGSWGWPLCQCSYFWAHGGFWGNYSSTLTCGVVENANGGQANGCVISGAAPKSLKCIQEVKDLQ